MAWHGAAFASVFFFFLARLKGGMQQLMDVHTGIFYSWHCRGADITTLDVYRLLPRRSVRYAGRKRGEKEESACGVL